MLILTTRCFVGTYEMSHSIKTTHTHAKLTSVSRYLADGRKSWGENENVNDLCDISSPSHLHCARDRRDVSLFSMSVDLAGDQKETLILIRAVKGNYPLTICNVLWLIWSPNGITRVRVLARSGCAMQSRSSRARVSRAYMCMYVARVCVSVVRAHCTPLDWLSVPTVWYGISDAHCFENSKLFL